MSRAAAEIARAVRRWLAAPAAHRARRADGALDEAAWERFGRLTLVAQHPARGGLGGEHRGRSRAPSSEFVDHRAYQPGDDLRRVDWNVYGRLGSLHVRLTELPERLDVLLALDCSASMRWGTPDKLAYACQVAGALGAIALRRADRLRLVRLDREARALGPLRGAARFPEVVQFLRDAQAGPGGELPLADRLTTLSAPPGRPLVVLISDLLDPDTAALGAAFDRLLRGGAELALIHVLSPQEEEPDAQGTVELVDSESGESLDLALSVAAVGRYRARLARWLAEIEGLAAARGVRYVRARSDYPLDALLLDDLRRVALVR